MSDKDEKTIELPRPAHAVDDDAPTRTLPATMADFEVHGPDAGADADPDMQATRILEPRAGGSRSGHADGEATTVLPVAAQPEDEPTQTMPPVTGTIGAHGDAATAVLPVPVRPDDDPTVAMPVAVPVTVPATDDAAPVAEPEPAAVPETVAMPGPIVMSGPAAESEPAAEPEMPTESEMPAESETRTVPEPATEPDSATDATGEPISPEEKPSIFPESAFTQPEPVFVTAAPATTPAPVPADPAPEPDGPASASAPSTATKPDVPYLTRTLPTQGGVPLYSAQPPAGGADDPNVHQVPRETPADPPAIRKTGPSAATITFGAILLLIGGLAMAFAFQFPWWAPQFAYDWRVVVALGCGALGAVLIVVAIAWSVVGLIRKK